MAVRPSHIERTWFAISPDGAEHELTFRVGYPEPRPEGDWVTSVSLGALEQNSFQIHGMDSWQAMEQGMKHVAVVARHHQSKGWRYLWERGGEEAAPAELARGTVEF